jgi:hypothetical protein
MTGTQDEVSAARRSIELFREADRLHRTRDPRALAAWDTYLRAAPGGALAPEARYNRALCLVRLRKLADARVALQPFANGREGGYRRGEARALLERIGR